MKSARQHKFVILVALLALLLAVPCFAHAAGLISMDTAISITPEKVRAIGDEVTVTITVRNTSGRELSDGVTIVSASGVPVNDFGVNGTAILAADQTETVTFTHEVTQADMSAGHITYLVRCPMINDEGEVENWEKKLKAPIAFDGDIVNLSVTRVITPEVARKSGTVNVIYTLTNSGTVDITDIKVQESVVKTAQTIKTLRAGATETLTFTTKMGNEALTSSAVIQYKAKGESGETSVESTSIPLASPNLTMTVTGPEEGVNIGEEAPVVITFDNKGNVTYTDVTISDSVKGTLLSGLTIEAGKTASFTAYVLLDGPTDLNLTAALKDNTGSSNSMNQKLHVNAYDPEKQVRLTLTLTASEMAVASTPADLTFRLVVTNDSNVIAKNIQITHGFVNNIASISALAPGESRTVQRNVRISTFGHYQFTATCTDELGNQIAFTSNMLTIEKKSVPTVTDVPRATNIPRPTDVPAETDDSAYKQRATLFFNVAVYVAIAAAVLGVFLVVILVIRALKNAHRKAAYDHLYVANHYDYTAPAGTRASLEEPTYPEAPERDVNSNDDDGYSMDDDTITIGAAPRKEEPAPEKAPVKQEEKPAEAETEETFERSAIPVIEPDLREEQTFGRRAVRPMNNQDEDI